jgi:glycosyltransferase involved in cell wall biosynthesis
MNSNIDHLERLGIGALLDALPGERYIAVRDPPKSLLWRAQRLLHRQAFPDSVEGVRGVGVAGDYILSALLKYSDAARFLFFVEPGQLVGEKARELLKARGLDRPGINVDSRTSLLNGGLGNPPLDAWLDIYGTAVDALALRNHFASRVYPVTTLQHAFSPHHLLYERFLRLLLMQVYPCDSIICTSRAGRQGIENTLTYLSENVNRDFGIRLAFQGRLDTIPLCADTDFFRPGNKIESRKRLRLPTNAIILIYVGYLAPIKADLVPLISVFHKLVRKNPQQRLMLLLVGTGWKAYLNMLLKRVRELKLDQHVVLLTKVSDETKRLALSASDIFVSPSDTAQEAFGLTPVEAMACGIPQVVSDWDGYRDTVRNGETGFLIPTYWTSCDDELVGTGDLLGWRYDHMVLGQSVAIDLDNLFQSLQELVRNEDLRRRMAVASRDRAVREFSYEAIARRYDALWHELAAQAAEVERLAARGRFDQPSYSAILQHYASEQVTDDTLVAKSYWVDRVTAIETQSANGWGRPVLSDGLLNNLVEFVDEHCPSGRLPLRVGALVLSMAEKGYRREIVRRHILWLIKYGYLRVAAAEVTRATLTDS